MSNVMTISGHGNGTGKSIIALNLAASLAVYEKKTLLIDCDPQGMISDWASMGDQGLASVMAGTLSLPRAIAHTEFNFLDVIPTGDDLVSQARRLSDRPDNEKLLRLLIEENREMGYEYIIIDAPSSNRYLSISSMTAADWLIIPFQPGLSSRKTVVRTLRDVGHVRRTHDTALGIAGFLMNRCPEGTDIQTCVEEEGIEDIADLIYGTHIPDDPSVSLTLEQNIPLVLSDIRSPAAIAFLTFAQEIDLRF